MKKIIFSIIICALTVLNITLPVMAENYRYVVTNPKDKTVTPVVMGTMQANKENTEYYINFFDLKTGQACYILPGEKKVGNFIKGECMIENDNDEITILDWREIKSDTFYKEKSSIIQERLQTGRKYRAFAE